MQYLADIKKLPIQSFYMAAGSLINRMGAASVLFLILYLHNYKDISIGFAGVIFSFYGVGALCSGPISGWLSDRYGAQILCIASLFLSGLIAACYPLVPNQAFIPVTFCLGLISEAYRPASQVIINHLCPPDQRKLAFSLNRLGQNVGTSIAPLVGSFLFVWHANAIFYVDGATSILAALFIYQVLWVYLKKNPIHMDSQQLLLPSLLAVFKDKRMVRVVVALVFSLLAFFQLLSTLSLFIVNDLKLTTTFFGLICLLNTLMVIGIELPLNIRMKHTPFHLALSVAALLIGCGFGLYYFAHGLAMMAAGAILWTFGEMILFPTVSAYIFEIAPLQSRGAYMGFFSVGVNTAFILGPLLGTLIYHYQSRDVWLFCFCMSVVSALLFYRLGRPVKV
jgi:MFS family permease